MGCFLDRQRPPKKKFGFVQIAFVLDTVCEVVDGRADFRVIFAKRCRGDFQRSAVQFLRARHIAGLSERVG